MDELTDSTKELGDIGSNRRTKNLGNSISDGYIPPVITHNPTGLAAIPKIAAPSNPEQNAVVIDNAACK